MVLPFAGAAQTRGPFHLTMDTNDTIETARAFADAVIVPVHTDGWAHFRQNANDLRASFDTLGFGPRLRILEPGVATVIEPLPPREAGSASGTECCPVRCRGGWTRVWQITTSRVQNDHAHKDAGRKAGIKG